ncbi:tRNA splicing endonuclease subunit 2 [Dermatophagoides farinae]|nr:uncharacterized protein LOC124494204 [Dermatophagoides farinae]
MDGSKKKPKTSHHHHHRHHHSLGKAFCKTQINLPFPYPMLDLKKKTIWPFSKEEFFMIAIGRLIEKEKLISIEHLPTILALNKMGFFGAHSSREIIFKSMIDSTTQNNRQQSQNKPKFTVGFFSLKTVDIPSALTTFIGDTNKLKKNENQNSTTTTKDQKTSFTNMKLNLEEAYFLSYVFGMLKIEKNPKEFYGLDELWQCCCRLSNDDSKSGGDCTKFVTRFAAYYYFRSQGFIVSNGFKFGVDYLLYEEGPPFNHSHYAVIVEYKYDDDDGDQKQNETCKYNEISGLIRISNNSRKELIQCTVIIPATYRSHLSDCGPGCIKYFHINLIHLQRQTLDTWQNNSGGGGGG